MVLFGCKKLLMPLNIQGGKRTEAGVISWICTTAFASYLQPAPLSAPTLPLALSPWMAALRNPSACFQKELLWNQVVELLHWAKEHKFVSYPSIKRKHRHLMCGQLSWKVKECREFSRCCAFGQTAGSFPTLYQSFTHARYSTFLTHGLETTAWVVWFGVGYYPW